jgi:hypothetical protein
MFEMGFTFPLPVECNEAIEKAGLVEGAKLPIYIHQYIDASKEDTPAKYRNERNDPGGVDE